MKTEPIVHNSTSPRNAAQPINMTAQDVAASLPHLKLAGIDISEAQARQIMSAADSLEPTVTTASTATPLQFLQEWMPGFVNVMTQARKADALIGMMVAGSFEDEEVVQGVLEMTGLAIPYGDMTNTNYSGWNVNWEQRTIIPFESGFEVGNREEARASRMNVNSTDSKRKGSGLALEIQRNNVAFNGYNNGANRTYGILNDPNLLPYNAAPNGNWAASDYLQMQQDILTAFQGLRTQSGDNVDAKENEVTLGIASDVVDFLSTTSDFGNSVYEWIMQNYPKTRIVSVPQFNAANGGANVMYAFAEKVIDESTDDGATWAQIVPTKFRLNGVEQKAKSFLESHSNATAGSMCKRPFAVYRQSGL